MEVNGPPSLEAACAALGVHPTPEQVATLIAYADLVLRWGTRINLTGATGRDEFIRDHLLDAVALLPHLDPAPGAAWADAGSGAGLPGLPLAVLSPQTVWHLVEPREKRWAFLLHAAHTLGLKNVRVHRARIEDAPVAEGVLQGVISRALGFDALAAFPWLVEGGTMAVITGDNLDSWGRAAAGLPLAPREPLRLRRGGGADSYLLRWSRI
ncbi:MAG: 16S rRNA (guanine(527)-N(7))-methyltransferase RsmG [Nitrospirota bacterium]|nr:16S rRNA (guanine(527)-N(7))-methyltransferase RsmG [Nitrospirota bacterium]